MNNKHDKVKLGELLWPTYFTCQQMRLSRSSKDHAHLSSSLVLYVSFQLDERRHDIRASNFDNEGDCTL